MSVENLLRDAIERASEGRVSVLLFRFNTPAGEVEFDAQITLDGNTIVCHHACVYPVNDPPGIKKATITKILLSELRKLHRIGQKLGYPNMDVLAKRDEESTSANPGKMVHIKLRRRK